MNNQHLPISSFAVRHIAAALLMLLFLVSGSLMAEPQGRTIHFRMKHPMKSVNGRCDEVVLSATPTFRREGENVALANPVQVTCPVSSLHTGDSNRDAHAYEALHYPKFQSIIIAISEGHCRGNDCQMTGTLNVAGVSKPIQLQAKREETAQSTRIYGTQIVRMTDHSIAPPSLLFMPMEDGVVVEFDFHFAK